MLFYSILFLLLSFCLFIAAYSKSYSRVSLFIFFIIFFLIAGLRGDVGQDTFNYQVHYDNLSSFQSFIDIIKIKEPFLYIIMYPHKLIFDSFTGFLLIVSFIQTYLLFYATKNMYHKSIFLSFYLFIFYLENHFNLIRVSFAVLFFLCCLSVIKINKKKAYLLFILALMSHLTALIFLPILLVHERLSFKKLLTSALVFILVTALVFLFFGGLIIDKLNAYHILELSEFRLPRAFLVIILSSFLLLLKKKPPRLFVLVFLLFSFSYFWSSASDIAYRIFFMYFSILIFLTFKEKSFDFKGFRITTYAASIMVLSCWLTISIWYGISLEKSTRLETGLGKAEFSLLPYSFYWDSKYRE